MNREVRDGASVFPNAAAGPDWRGLLADQFRQNGRLFFRLAFDIVRDAAAAEDICQQGMVKALQQKERIREAAALRAWLMEVVLNDSLQLLRQRKLEASHLSKNWTEETSVLSGVGPAFELRESLLKAMERLPERTRLIVALRKLEGLSGNDVTKLLGCSAKEVSVHLHRGMEILRQVLND
jgi:RNA polymerase sigma-70 factor (ECF subfamily)